MSSGLSAALDNTITNQMGDFTKIILICLVQDVNHFIGVKRDGIVEGLLNQFSVSP